jgi:pyrroline-5-carboxylate reductase
MLRLQQAYPDGVLTRSNLWIWAVKPQVFQEAAASAHDFADHALHLSVAAGISSTSITQWLSTDRVVRCMPNMPALMGKGMTGVFACDSVSNTDKLLIEKVLCPTGQFIWVDQEAHLDAVTALSGSGPAYVFYFLEAMQKAGIGMGLSAQQAYKLAVATFSGAAALAEASAEGPDVLRQRVTSKGGTTHAAISAMDAAGVDDLFVQAMYAAQQRAQEMGEEFGRS